MSAPELRATGDAPGADEPADDTDEDAPRRQSSRRAAIEWVIVIGGAVVVALVIKTLLLQAFYIPSSSMEPTLHLGDRVLVNKLSYHLHGIHRGDIVVFERPRNSAAGDVPDLIKRVVALPGESVEVQGGKVFVDHHPLDEPYLPKGTITPDFTATGCSPQCKVPTGHVFVLGDNRGNSQASNIFGPIDDDLIVGRAFVRIWPIKRIGGI